MLPWPVAHGTSQLHTSDPSRRFSHHLMPAALGGVNRIETYTSVCNLYIATLEVSGSNYKPLHVTVHEKNNHIALGLNLR